MCLKFGVWVILVASIVPFAASLESLTKEEQIEKMQHMNEEMDIFRRNLTECARQVKATVGDIDNFIKRVPQTNLQGKCLVACILKRNDMIRNNKIQPQRLIEVNEAVYGRDSEVIPRMAAAIQECADVVEDTFEICEFASVFNDCMHMKLEHILDKVLMERRMTTLGQMDEAVDEWSDDDEFMRMIKDEL